MRSSLLHLSNGLPVLTIPQRHLSRSHVAFYVRVGSRFETKATNGLSHFLEHMLYRGTPRLKDAHAVNLAFEELGSFLDAETYVDHGQFSITLPPESLTKGVRLFAEVICDPCFFDVRTEQGIVCEEILEDLDDEQRQINADNLSRALIYPTHPLGFTITGTAELVRSFKKADLIRHHARHYTAGNGVLVFSGQVERSQAERCARFFERLPAGDRICSTPVLHRQSRPRVLVVENASSQTELRVCFRAPSENSAERAPLEMFMRIVDDGMSTQLYHRVSDARGLCYDISAGYDGYEDDGVVDFRAGVAHARVAVVTREILSLLNDLAASGPTAQELSKAKQRAAWELRSMRDAPDTTANFFGLRRLFGRSTRPEDWQAELEQVTKNDVRRVARLLRDASRVNIVAVGLLDASNTRALREIARAPFGS